MPEAEENFFTKKKDTSINAPINPVICSAVDQGFPMILMSDKDLAATPPSTLSPEKEVQRIRVYELGQERFRHVHVINKRFVL